MCPRLRAFPRDSPGFFYQHFTSVLTSFFTRFICELVPERFFKLFSFRLLYSDFFSRPGWLTRVIQHLMNEILNHTLLRSFTPFDDLAPEYLDKVIEKAEICEFPKGTIVFKRGKELTDCFYLVQGNIDLIDTQFTITSIDTASEARRVPLNSSSPTKVSAISKSPVVLLKIERDFLDLVMAWSESNGSDDGSDDEGAAGDDSDDWMSALLQAPLFSKVPPGNISQLFSRFNEHKVPAGETVVKEGERGELFYVLKSGSAEVRDVLGNKLAILYPGDYFGEEALVGDTTRNATVKMLTKGALMCLGKEDFKILLHEPVTRFITVEELRERQKNWPLVQILDVRLAIERRIQHLPGSRNIPLGGLRKALAGLELRTVYLVADDAGRRSDVAAQLLIQAGFETYILKHADQHYADHLLDS